MSPEQPIPSNLIPDPADYGFDLDAALASVVLVRTTIPADAFTAGPLGTERGGYGVLIRGDGLVLTIGYLVTEAETVWLTLTDGRAVPGHVLGYDQETGFGLIQALARLDLPALPLGNSAAARVGDAVVVGGAGGRERSVAARIVAKQEFAGYWEYLLDEAIITAPAHPHWGGAALIGEDGRLLGIGSLLVQSSGGGGKAEDHNMVVPIDLLPPILDDMLTLGRPRRPARPWLGVYVTEIEGRVVVANLADAGPAAGAGVRAGDLILAAGDGEVDCLATFYRRVWAQGPAGVAVPLRIYRDGKARELTVPSADRNDFLKSPVAH
ncbi:MAG: serine protease [Hyphomicrobiales bacterium]|nr:serine protease [Hyphomicrobiales bacterium]MCP5371068.1 serine protease [Hyphomicrobiales bacterium]